MPGKGDKMTVWDDKGKHKLRKYYLTMYLKEACVLYLESCKNEDDKCFLSNFVISTQRLCFFQVPKEQCKCHVHENLFLKLEATRFSYESSWLQTVLCDISPNSPCWNNTCENCKDGKKLIPTKGLNASTCYKQWEYIEAPSHSKNEDDDTYKKIAIVVVKEVRVGEVLNKFEESFTKVKERQNVKQSQADEFQNDLNDALVRVSQIDYALEYQCELQKRTMAALWTRGSVNLFTCATCHNSIIKTMLFCTNYKGKDKFSTWLYLSMLYRDHILSSDEVETEVVWSDGSSSEFKNQYIHLLMPELSNKYIKPFIWKFSATSYGKGVVDGGTVNPVYTRNHESW